VDVTVPPKCWWLSTDYMACPRRQDSSTKEDVEELV
jgi:hypothetical protein